MPGSSSSRCAAPGSRTQARTGGAVACIAASILALALPSAAPALVEGTESTGREADLTWTARWDDVGFGLDVADDVGRPRLAWTASDPLRCALRHRVLDGLRLEGGVAFAPDSDAWRRLMLEDAPTAEQLGGSELFHLDATVELVAELGDRRTGTAWRVGLGGGWSRAESVLGMGRAPDDGSMGLDGFLADDPQPEGAGTASDASGEGVVWLRFSRAF
ncbi:MAG: hypothetical protein LW806_09175 [Planctomycetaceae bacterium]|nr:hypothetical protein [Planctomycetaceae bacterium]